MRISNNMGGDIFLQLMKNHEERFSNDCHDFITNQELDGEDFLDEDWQPQAAAEERRIYWESQEFLLQEILEQYNSSCSKLREHIQRHIDIVRNSNFCNCPDQNIKGCIKCLRIASINQLCSKGFNASLCTSKWNRTHKIPGGKHEYIEVIASTQGRRKQITFLVELGFLDEFKMAKACPEYNRLIDQLPEVYIGKVEHLNAIVRVVCEAAKKSAEELKIHMGPWRKRGFMQMKWSASRESRVLESASSERRAVLDHSSTMDSSFQLPVMTTGTVKVA